MWFGDPAFPVLSHEFLVDWLLELPLTMPQGSAIEQNLAIQRINAVRALVIKFDLVHFLLSTRSVPDAFDIFFEQHVRSALGWRGLVPPKLFDTLYHMLELCFYCAQNFDF